MTCVPVSRILVPLCAALLAACAAGPHYHTPQLPLPARYDAARDPSGAPAGEVDVTRWWRALKDPELDSLIARAITGNPDLRIALDHLQAARAFEAASIGAVLPEAGAAAGGGKGTGSDLTRGRAPQALVSADNGSDFAHINGIAGFDALWQLDVFGKYRREIEATRADTEALAAARNAVLIAIVADVASGYVDLRGLQVRAQVLKAASDALRDSLRIVSIRYQRGITNELDVTLATRELGVLEAQEAPLAAQIRAAQYSLATLLGVYPEELVEELSSTAMVPSVPQAVDPGLPLDLLRRRPDIQEAERQLAAATARIGVATADLFPSLAVNGAVGVQRQGLGNIPLSEHIWSVGAAVAWPLLDFGALDAQVEAADLQARALLVNYKKTIQGAVREVDTDLGQFGAEQASLGKLDGALIASQRAVTLASERYQRGLTDFLNVIDAQRQEYDIEEQYAAAQVAAAEDFIALYRSLGGGWQDYQQLPPIHRPQPAVIAAFERVLHTPDPQREESAAEHAAR